MSHTEAKEIFLEAIALDGPGRAALLDDRCAGRPELAARVARLVDAHHRAEHFMSAPTVDPGSSGSPAPPPAAAPDTGARIGPYTLGEVLGEGGFGRVHLAQQHEPVSRTVALKVLKSGVDSAAIVARFEAERQALALMDHPNVARVFDGGQTPDGRPYFVMEHVPGEPLTTYCESRAMPMRARLELFEQVCLAVQHAHQKGIIHRDLKPANVLVTTIDGRPVPKVIDFGIAKAIGASPSDAAVTLEGQIVGTPAYMSPEQFGGGALLDTRSDIYTLGVLLYEILTGELPFEIARLQGAPLASVARIICEQAPQRPSTRVLQRARAGDGPCRGTQRTRHCAARLKGDLDWIVMRAIEKDPARRYQTALALAADIRRFLADRAVEAGPPGGAYRLRKFALRHRGELAAAAVVMVVLVAGLVSSLVFAARTERQRELTAGQLEKATLFAEFLTGLLSGLDPAVARGEDRALLRRMLDDAVERIDREPPARADVEAEMRRLLGTALHKIAAFPEAGEQFAIALERARASLGPDHETTLGIWQSLAQVHVENSRFDLARPELIGVLEAKRRALGPDHPDTVTAMFNLAALDRLAGRLPLARDRFARVVELRAAALGDGHRDTMSARNSLATVLDQLGDHQAAIDLYEQVIAFQTAELGPDHPHTLATRNNLADAYASVGRADEAVAMLESVIESKRRILAPDHPSLIASLNNLAHLFGKLGRSTEARRIISEALEISRASLGERDFKTLVLTSNLARAMHRDGEHDEAIDLLAPARAAAEEAFGEAHPLTLAMQTTLALAHLGAGRPAAAAPIAGQLVERTDASSPDDDPARAASRRLYARTLLAQGDAPAALTPLEEALALQTQGVVRDDGSLAETEELLAQVRSALDDSPHGLAIR